MVYIQSNNEKTLPHHFDCACGLWGALDNAMEYRFVTYDEVASGKFDLLIRNHLFIGSVEFMREVFHRIGKDDVRVPRNNDSEFEVITLGEAKEIAKNGKKIFIKPFEIKLFTGFVLDQSIYSCLNGIPDDTKVMCYEPYPTNILSEWRYYISNGEAVDCHCYGGDFNSYPDFVPVAEAIYRNTDFPSAYTIDVAVFREGKTIIVEYNDMWAIGNYGIPNDMYVRLLKQRYFEIVKG